MPTDFVWLLNYLFTTVLVDSNATLADGVKRAVGRAPRDFSDYVRATAATSVWDPTSLTTVDSALSRST